MTSTDHLQDAYRVEPTPFAWIGIQDQRSLAASHALEINNKQGSSSVGSEMDEHNHHCVIDSFIHTLNKFTKKTTYPQCESVEISK